jgi:hypothetical protein
VWFDLPATVSDLGGCRERERERQRAKVSREDVRREVEWLGSGGEDLHRRRLDLEAVRSRPEGENE